MGCDIHLHLEYLHPSWGIEPVIANTFSVDRDYGLFAVLAGVRNYNDLPVLVPPRGVPDDVSFRIHEQFYAEIVPDDAHDWQKNLMHEWCYESDAKNYVEKYGSHIKEFEGGIRYVSNPDWHSASYLTREEVIEVCRHSQYDLAKSPVEFQIVMDFMKSLDERFGESVSRIVFWFDN